MVVPQIAARAAATVGRAKRARKPRRHNALKAAKQPTTQLQYDSPDNYLRHPDSETRTAASNNANERSRQVRNNAKRILRTRRLGKQALGKLGINTDFGTKNVARINAAAASWTIVMMVFPFWIIQLILFGLMLSSLVLESSWLGFVLPGQTAAMVFAILGMVFNLLTMILAIAIFVARGVDIMSGWKDLVTALFIAFGLIPVMIIIPWVFFYCLCVTLLQTGQKPAVA